jgi:hypothetical protein
MLSKKTLDIIKYINQRSKIIIKISVLNIHGNHITFPTKRTRKVFAEIYAIVSKHRHSPKWNNFKSAIQTVV